jgi:GNAT superfamily N-acetyltransferase
VEHKGIPNTCSTSRFGPACRRKAGGPFPISAIIVAMTPQVEVRPMSEDDDWEALAVGHPLSWLFPFWKTLNGIDWFTGLLDGRPAGLAAGCSLPYAADRYGVGALNVVPEARRHGLGTALYEATVEAVRGRAPGIQFNRAADDQAAEAAAAAWGLRETGRHQESVLDLTTFDRAAFEAKAAAPGVRIEPLPPLVEIDDRAWQDLYAFYDARSREAPDAVGGESLPYDEFRAMLHQPWMLATARDDAGGYVGITLVMDHPAKPEGANTFFTVVVGEGRGRGIATALKCHQALLMADVGVTSLTTQNMEGNEAILAANRTLGFVPDFVYVDLVLAL